MSLTACGAPDSLQQDVIPTAVINADRVAGHVLLPLAFDGSRSNGFRGQITQFNWDFGDGQSASGERVTHAWSTPGEYVVTLTVTDNQGVAASASVDIRTHAQSAGYYTGTAISEVTGEDTQIEVIIGANNIIHAFDYQHLRTSFWGRLTSDDHQVAGELSAELRDPSFVFPDGSNLGTVDIDAMIEPGHAIYGSFGGKADAGVVDLYYNERIAERPSSIDDISGSWHWNDPNGFSATVVVDDSGRLDYSDSNGCRGIGRLEVIEPALNGFEFRTRWICSASEDPRWNGDGEGIVFVDDYYLPGKHRLVFAESTWNGSSTVWAVERIADDNLSQLVAESAVPPMRTGRHNSFQ